MKVASKFPIDLANSITCACACRDRRKGPSRQRPSPVILASACWSTWLGQLGINALSLASKSPAFPEILSGRFDLFPGNPVSTLDGALSTGA